MDIPRMSAAALSLSSPDDDRRLKLKNFLISYRSRLKPQDVGLPETARRRVNGLRREEIAELVGVSTDWYRWFEAGRPVRVSMQFLARLSEALRLDPVERIALFYLALPEVYEAYAAQPHLRSPLHLVRQAAPCET
jgi:Helix-turn-helix domain